MCHPHRAGKKKLLSCWWGAPCRGAFRTHCLQILISLSCCCLCCLPAALQRNRCSKRFADRCAVKEGFSQKPPSPERGTQALFFKCHSPAQIETRTTYWFQGEMLDCDWWLWWANRLWPRPWGSRLWKQLSWTGNANQRGMVWFCLTSWLLSALMVFGSASRSNATFHYDKRENAGKSKSVCPLFSFNYPGQSCIIRGTRQGSKGSIIHAPF